jgi:hypothetical protein
VTVAASVGFSLTVPRDWYELDLMPATRDASLKALVYEQTRQVPELRAMRADIVRLVREFAVRAHEAGAVYCACFVTPTDAGPVTGSMTVTVVDPPPGPDGPELDRLLDLLSTPGGPTVAVADLKHVGQVARTYGVEDVPLPEGGSVRSVVMQTFVPLGDGRVALVTASSPVLWLEESLLDLFDAVTSTFRLVDEVA